METQKYMRESCYHRIECFVTNSLAAFMWKRPLNSATLAIPTHRKLGRVSKGTDTQIVAWMINKWRAKIGGRELYNVRYPNKQKGPKKQERHTVAIKNQTCNHT